MRCFFALLAALCCSTASVAQKDQSAKQQVTTFQSGVNLVLVPVIVRNKQGQAVGNLTQDDFQIFDKGKRQSIVSFAANKESYSSVQSKSALNSTNGNVSANSPNRPDTIASVDASTNPTRFIAYVFDDLNVTFADMAAVRSAVSQHLRALSSTDRAAIYTFSGSPQIDFTGDREKLEQTVATLRERSTSGHDDAKECPNVSVYLADLVLNQDDRSVHDALVQHTVSCAHIAATDHNTKVAMAEAIFLPAARRQLSFGEQQSRMALRTLRLAIRRLADMPGDRLIILTSPGFFAQTPETISDLQEVLKLAAQEHITISTLNARGLSTNQPDAGSDDASTAWWGYQRQSSQAAEGILQDLAKGTGGVFVHNNDGFRAAFDRLAKPPEFSYVLGFSPTNSKPDGKFHSIKIRLLNEKGLTIEARNGYYALQQNPAKENARLDVDDALFSRDQRNEIPVVLQTGYVKPNTGDPTVTVVVKVDLKSLHFRIANQRNLDTLTVVSALFNADGSYLTGTTKTVNLQLRNETLNQTDPSVTLRFNFPVKRGAYVIRLVIRDRQSGAMTTLTRPEKIT